MKLLVVTIFLLTSNILAKTYEVNGQHSFVNFELDYMKVSEVKGTFDRFEGAFEWDSQKNQLSDVEFQIFVKSINTRDKKRDNHLKRKDFFDVKKFPVMSFLGKKIKYKNGKPVSVAGDLTLKDITKPHVFEIDWKGEFPDPVDKNKKSLFLKVKTKINRTDFGITWNRALDQGGWIVGDDVDVEIVIEANPTDARPAFSRFYRKTREILPGKLEMPKETTLSGVPEKKSPINSLKDSKEDSTGHLMITAKLIGGFVLFCLLCIFGYFLKKKMMELFEKNLSPLWNEALSDLVLFSLLFGAAILLAPFMGYEKFF